MIVQTETFFAVEGIFALFSMVLNAVVGVSGRKFDVVSNGKLSKGLS
jgi:hypothetical protein